jgi:hypothetical protein
MIYARCNARTSCSSRANQAAYRLFFHVPIEVGRPVHPPHRSPLPQGLFRGFDGAMRLNFGSLIARRF